MPPKDFTKINKILLKKNLYNNGEKIQDKEIRKKLSNIRKKLIIEKKQKFKIKRNASYVYGLSKPRNENIANLIYNIYGNKAEETLNKNYEEFITEKSRRKKMPKVSPRYISPKVEEMKKKEEERKANLLSDNNYNINLYKKKEKPLYKLKMFQDVGSKVAENIRKFRTFKPLLNKKSINKSQEFDVNVIDNVISDVKKKEQNDINL